MSYVNTLLASNSLKQRKPTLEESTIPRKDDSWIVSLLEFDEEMCMAELECTRKFYRSLLESSDVVIHEGVVQSIIEFITKAIEKVKEFFSNLFSKSGGEGSSGGNNSLKGTIEKLNQKIANVDKYRDKYKSFA